MEDLIPFLIGVIIGVIIISKLISFCFKKYKEQTEEKQRAELAAKEAKKAIITEVAKHLK